MNRRTIDKKFDTGGIPDDFVSMRPAEEIARDYEIIESTIGHSSVQLVVGGIGAKHSPGSGGFIHIGIVACAEANMLISLGSKCGDKFDACAGPKCSPDRLLG